MQEQVAKTYTSNCLIKRRGPPILLYTRHGGYNSKFISALNNKSWNLEGLCLTTRVFKPRCGLRRISGKEKERNEGFLDPPQHQEQRVKVMSWGFQPKQTVVRYVPSAHECPLLLRLPNGDISETNGFISPMWGGVVVWNPPNCSSDCQMRQLNRNTISPEEMGKIFQVFIGQLRLLFGFKSDYFHVLGGRRLNFLPSKRGFTEWELDVLYRRHACSNLLSCASTLESLSKLVQSLPRMIVTDEIGKQVKFSLEVAGLAQNDASLGVYDASAVSSRKARALAEDAFFHPSIMSISYSSIEHYFAVYMPFFAPVSLHVLLAAIKEIKRYKTEKAKYLSFAAVQATAS